jgi:hypothetical protein
MRSYVEHTITQNIPRDRNGRCKLFVEARKSVLEVLSRRPILGYREIKHPFRVINHHSTHLEFPGSAAVASVLAKGGEEVVNLLGFLFFISAVHYRALLLAIVPDEKLG